MVDWQSAIDAGRRALGEPFVQSAGVLLLGLIVGVVVRRLMKRALVAGGVPSMVQGTSFERTARSLGTSTVAIVAGLSAWVVYGVAVIIAVQLARLVDPQAFWTQVTGFLPGLFVAVLVLIVGFVAADKIELLVSERLRGVKLPEVTIVPKIIKYSLLYVVFLIALGQIRVNTQALLIMLAAYLFAVIFLCGIAFRRFLASGATGVYLLLHQPYSIGDEIRVGDHQGVVQGMDVFVTRIEDDGEEFIVPNEVVFEHGVVRIRD